MKYYPYIYGRTFHIDYREIVCPPAAIGVDQKIRKLVRQCINEDVPSNGLIAEERYLLTQNEQVVLLGIGFHNNMLSNKSFCFDKSGTRMVRSFVGIVMKKEDFLQCSSLPLSSEFFENIFVKYVGPRWQLSDTPMNIDSVIAVQEEALPDDTWTPQDGTIRFNEKAGICRFFPQSEKEAVLHSLKYCRSSVVTGLNTESHVGTAARRFQVDMFNAECIGISMQKDEKLYKQTEPDFQADDMERDWRDWENKERKRRRMDRWDEKKKEKKQEENFVVDWVNKTFDYADKAGDKVGNVFYSIYNFFSSGKKKEQRPTADKRRQADAYRAKAHDWDTYSYEECEMHTSSETNEHTLQKDESSETPQRPAILEDWSTPVSTKKEVTTKVSDTRSEASETTDEEQLMVFDWGTSDAPLKQAPLVHSSEKENEIETFPHIEHPKEVVTETIATGEGDEKEEIVAEEVPVTIAEEKENDDDAKKSVEVKEENGSPVVTEQQPSAEVEIVEPQGEEQPHEEQSEEEPSKEKQPKEDQLKEEELKEEQSKDELKVWNPNGTDKE